ncbi:MAG: hypothetical protein AAGF92_01310 [Myxococcota bacterium]
MRWFLACVLVAVGGCGDSDSLSGSTVVNIRPAEAVATFAVLCGDQEEEDRVRLGQDRFQCEFPPDMPDVCQHRMDLPPGITCTMIFGSLDPESGEPCRQEEELVVAETGPTEVDVTLDNCAPVTAGD